MAIAVLGDIPDSERFIELAETPPAIDLPATLQSEQASSYVSVSTSIPPFRPRRSSQRVKQIFIPASHHEAKINDSERRLRNDSIIDLYGSSSTGVVNGGDNNNDDAAAERDQPEEQFYSPLSSPALFGTTQHKNRTSEIPLLAPSPLNNGIANSHHGGNIKEAGVKRAFRSKVGTDGSISLSILPSAAALNEMLELSGSNNHSTTSEILSTYQPATTFTKSTSTMNDHSANNGKEDGGAVAAGGNSDLRRPSEANSINTRPLTIKRKKPAIYQPDQGALPVSRAASFDACTPTSEHPPLPTMYLASSPTTTTAQQISSPRRGSDAAASLPVTQTFQTPLRRIPQSDASPPATPPTWTGSTRSDTYTEDESLPVSPRSSGDRQVPPKAIGRNLNGLKLDYGQSQVEETDTAKDLTAPKIIQTTSNGDEESEYPTPLMCNIEDMQDRPGVLRRESDDESSDMDYDDDDDDDEDDTSDHNFGLESFPVPSVNLSSAKNTPRMYPVSPLLGVDGHNHFNPNITASPAQRKASIASSNSRLRPKTDLYPIPTDADGNQEWDQATELEIRDRVFRAEIKKPSKVDKARRKALQKVFEQLKRPTKSELYEASLYSVRDENGHKVRFGTLFEEKRTIVCFIRHFWCSQCQNYVDAITKVRPEVLAKHNMNLVIVSNGSWKMIKSYRKLLGNKCPYPIYTDRAKHIYTCLGMTLRSWDAGKGPEVGNYIQHSLGGSIIAGIKSGVKLPLKPPGDQQQLGGEFVLGPGLHVTFAHRMKTTRGHAEIEEVLASAGINLEEENKALGIRDDNESNNGHLDASSHKKEKDHRKRSSAIHYSTNSNGEIGSTTMQSTPSLASSILNRLSSPRTAPSSPKRFTTGGSKTGSPVVSQPGSPMASTTHFGNGAGIGNTSPPTSPTRARSKRLVKKNRNSAPANGLFADSTTPSSSALGATSNSQSPLLGGLSLSQSMNDLRSRRRNKGGRPLSTSTLPESRTVPSLSAYNDAPTFANGIREEEEGVAVPAAGGAADPADGEEEFNRIRNSLQNRSRKHSSAPPVIPTPTTVTPLSMGFLQVPTPPVSSSSSDLKGLNGSMNNKSQQPQQPSFFYSSIPNGASTTSVNGIEKANGRASSSESVSKVTIAQPLQTRSQQQPADLKHRYSASALPPREKKEDKCHQNGNNARDANGYLGVHPEHGDGLHSEDIRATSSRFSESSGEEEATSNHSKNTKKKNLSSSTKRSSAGTSSTLSSSGPRSFVRSLTLRSSSSSLSAPNRPTIVRLDSK